MADVINPAQSRELRVGLTLNSGATHSLIAKISDAIASLPDDRALRLLDGVLDLFDKGGAIDFNVLPTPGTGELCVTLKPSEALVALMAAAGAGNFDGGAS